MSLGEFGRIARYFQPLAAGYPGARALLDDTASLSCPPGHELVVSMDAMVAGVHFIGDEPPVLIGRKLLRVNLSDLAAAGATPLAYTLATALPHSITEAWVAEFAGGLAQDQAEFAIHLAGGDTVKTTGPVTLIMTIFGSTPCGRVVTRAGARAGDLVFVTGQLGDAALGLAVAQGRLAGEAADHRAVLARYHLPQPRIAFGERALRTLATAAVDVSDGLMADLGHVAAASKVTICLEAARLPASPAARRLADPVRLLAAMAGGGDDYELALTVSPEDSRRLQQLADEMGLLVTQIGSVMPGPAEVRLVDAQGRSVALESVGYQHF